MPIRSAGKQHNGKLAKLQGQTGRITCTNEENGFTIAKVNVSGRQDLAFSTA
jgi:hypothetical protein